MQYDFFKENSTERNDSVDLYRHRTTDEFYHAVEYKSVPGEISPFNSSQSWKFGSLKTAEIFSKVLIFMSILNTHRATSVYYEQRQLTIPNIRTAKDNQLTF